MESDHTGVTWGQCYGWSPHIIPRRHATAAVDLDGIFLAVNGKRKTFHISDCYVVKIFFIQGLHEIPEARPAA